jgi:hypothetical protein
MRMTRVTAGLFRYLLGGSFLACILWQLINDVRTNTHHLPSDEYGVRDISKPNKAVTTSRINSVTSAMEAASPLPASDRMPPRNLRVVFVGDSVSRFMYLSFVYYLKSHGQEWAPDGHRLLEKILDPSPRAWNEWYAYTRQEMQPYETCDCFRHWNPPGFDWNRHCENRYFQDAQHNNTVTFLTKFGMRPPHGHWKVSQTNHPYIQSSGLIGEGGTNSVGQLNTTYEWTYGTWDALVDQYIAQFDPKPTVMIFNNGLWGTDNTELRWDSILQKLKDVLDLHSIRGIYRTTSFQQVELRQNFNATSPGMTAVELYERLYSKNDYRRHDATVCRYFECMNVSWTYDLSPSDYVDTNHFKAPISNLMSQQFLNDFLFRNDNEDDDVVAAWQPPATHA